MALLHNGASRKQDIGMASAAPQYDRPSLGKTVRLTNIPAFGTHKPLRLQQVHIRPHMFRFEAFAVGAVLKASKRKELGPARPKLAPTPEIAAQFTTDAGMTAFEPSSDCSETELLGPPPINKRSFFQIKMPIAFGHIPPPAEEEG